MFLMSRQRRLRSVFASLVYNRAAANRVMWVFPRLQRWFETLLSDRTGALDDERKRRLRVSKRTFTAICDKIGPEIAKQNTKMRQSVPVPKRVAIALWRPSTGDTFRSSGLQFGCGKSTTIEIVDEVTRALLRLSPSIIRFPSTAVEVQDHIDSFEETAGFPEVQLAP